MKKTKSPGLAASPLPLPSLRLLVSPLQLAYSYIWQVILKRSVKNYDKVEEFVTTVTQIIPELMSSKQIVQLTLGLRARIILELLKADTPDSQAVQALINKLRISTSADKDSEVEMCQTNFMVLVQSLLRNAAERKHFFQDVFPVLYGSKYDTALQSLIAGLVWKLEQLLPVPNLTQLGAMITTQPSVLEECGSLMPDQGDLKVLLLHQQPKGLLSANAISSTVGDCVLSSLSTRLDPVEPPASQSVSETAGSPPPLSDAEDAEAMSDDTETPATPVDTSAKCVSSSPKDEAVTLKEKEVTETEGVGAATEEMCPSQEISRETSDTAQSVTPPQGVDEGASPPKLVTSPEKVNLQQLSERSLPFRIIQVPVGTTSDGAGDRGDQQRPQTQRVTLHQWVSQIAINSLSLPALPPLTPSKSGPAVGTKPPVKKKKQAKPPANRFICNVCEKSFSYQSQLTDHQRIHTGEKPFVCTACGKSFRTQTLLNSHLITHNAARPYSCGQCGRCFHKMPCLRKHMLVHSGQKPFYCGICNKGFTQSTYFKRHMECHTSQTSFPCEECGKTFPTQFKLANHQRWHSRDLPHMCERCGKRFLVPSLLKRHMGYHIGNRPYLCSQCGRTFVYMSDLKRHQQDHGPKTKLPCHVCQKKFSSKYCLRIHLRIHNREKPYACHICEKAFTQIGNLKVHVRLHTDERPYSCDQCGKTYKLSSHLNVHKRTHLCKKPWTCETCGKGFTIPGLLRKHEQLHAREAAGFSSKQQYRSKRKKQALKTVYDEDGDDGSEDY